MICFGQRGLIPAICNLYIFVRDALWCNHLYKIVSFRQQKQFTRFISESLLSMHAFKYWLIVPVLLLLNDLVAQNYQAINGSPYAGSLAPANNPAAIVHVPYAWDITPFAVQLKQSTNAYKIEKYSFLSSPQSAEISATGGNKKRFLFANQDIRLFNARINLNSRAAIAGGATIRNYVSATTGGSNYNDTIYSLADFMKINTDHLPLSADATGSAWGELYATYAQTIVEDGNKLINAGVTLKISQALAGGFGRARNLNYVPGFPRYVVTDGSLQYGYSANFDLVKDGNSASLNRKIFLKNTTTNISADFGFEYILRTDEEKEEGGDFAYETKVGVSLMDVGANKYKYSNNSTLAAGVKAAIDDSLLENKFSNPQSVTDFNDSLASIANTFVKVNGEFFIYRPVRLVVNIDKHIINNIFINADITLPLMPVFGKNTLFIKDMNLVAITPRWETKLLGVYMPILFNNRNQLWVGGAFKAGPLLLGTHNLANIFAKNKTQSGGLYLALTVRASRKYDRNAHNPGDKQKSRSNKNLDCPKF